ncbi:hypothetical protein KQ940_11050 [Marinobacterium sp. D7]|uniref:hypothetical protein n=1 Tax=Marinobacterium ramblicola TaxID=2849041 RepID=UPI001C2DDB18|nr:hypothetical protein [Marinobacterium ramblicola]MBV1788592.1 hypothetical protein [Marinobacterium ramblicola]
MSESQEWNGRNRRTSEDRRQQPDRREEIRFEPGKKDRRQNRGRRTEDRDMWEDAMKDK